MLATIVMGEFSFEVTAGDKTLCASDNFHGISAQGKDWNELVGAIVDAIYDYKGDEYKVGFNYIPEPGEEDAVIAAIKHERKKERYRRRLRFHRGSLRKWHRGTSWDLVKRRLRYKEREKI